MIADLEFDVGFFVDFVFTPNRALLVGIGITVVTAVLAQTLGTLIGMLSALGSLSVKRPLRIAAGFYVWFFRGTPTLVQIFLVYFGVPALLGVDIFPTDMVVLGVTLSGAVVAGTVALAANEGGYMSEIIRAGILSVDPGQHEAALAVGMTRRQMMRRIILPQAARIIVPPLGNNFNNMLKITSLLSVIGVRELFRVAQGVNAATFKTFEAFLGAAFYYLALLTLFGLLQSRVERRLGAHTGRRRRAAPRSLEGEDMDVPEQLHG